MHRTLLAPPLIEPVTRDMARAHLRLGADTEADADEDALLGALLVAARVAVETEIRQVLIDQTWRLHIDRLPRSGLRLPVGPARALVRVARLDEDGAETPLPVSDFALDPADGTVALRGGAASADAFGGVLAIDWLAGFGPTGADVPRPLAQGILMLLAHWYENRSAVSVGTGAASVPEGLSRLLTPYRRLQLC